MAGQLRRGDVGSVIRIAVKENGTTFDISAATLKQLKVKHPDGTGSTWVPSFESGGADGVLVYATLAADLDQAGPWTGQVYLEFVGGKWHTEPFSFTVGAVL